MALHCRLRLGPRHSLPDQRAPEWRVRGRGPDRSVRRIRLLRARRGAQRRLTATHPGDHLSVSSPLAIIALRRPTASLGQIRRERPRNEPTASRVYASRGFNWSARAASGRGSRPAEAWAIASPRWYSHFCGSCAEALVIAATAASGRPCCRSQYPRIWYGSGRTASASIDDRAWCTAVAQSPRPKARALFWRWLCEKRISAGVAAATARAAASGTRPDGPAERPPPERLVASAAPAAAHTHAGTAGISQSQSTPAWTAQATKAANRAA